MEQTDVILETARTIGRNFFKLHPEQSGKTPLEIAEFINTLSEDEKLLYNSAFFYIGENTVNAEKKDVNN